MLPELSISSFCEIEHIFASFIGTVIVQCKRTESSTNTSVISSKFELGVRIFQTVSNTVSVLSQYKVSDVKMIIVVTIKLSIPFEL